MFKFLFFIIIYIFSTFGNTEEDAKKTPNQSNFSSNSIKETPLSIPKIKDDPKIIAIEREFKKDKDSSIIDPLKNISIYFSPKISVENNTGEAKNSKSETNNVSGASNFSIHSDQRNILKENIEKQKKCNCKTMTEKSSKPPIEPNKLIHGQKSQRKNKSTIKTIPIVSTEKSSKPPIEPNRPEEKSDTSVYIIENEFLDKCPTIEKSSKPPIEPKTPNPLQENKDSIINKSNLEKEKLIEKQKKDTIVNRGFVIKDQDELNYAWNQEIINKEIAFFEDSNEENY